MKYSVMLLALLVATPALAADDTNTWSQQEIAAGLKVTDFTRYVRSGQSFAQNFGFYLPDCSLMEDSIPTVIKQPDHGTITIDMQSRFANFPKEAVHYAKCNEKKIRTPVLTYKAEAGYSGTDTFEVTANHSNGLMRQWNFTIKVTNGKKPIDAK